LGENPGINGPFRRLPWTFDIYGNVPLNEELKHKVRGEEVDLISKARLKNVKVLL